MDCLIDPSLQKLVEHSNNRQERGKKDEDCWLPPTVDCNGLCYCERHGRDICPDCKIDFSPNNGSTFLWESGVHEYPVHVDPSDPQKMRDAERWRKMQAEMYPGPFPPLKRSSIYLPAVENFTQIKSSPRAMQETLLLLFHQAQCIATEQRYTYSNRPRIMLEDYDTFRPTVNLDEDELRDCIKRGFDLLKDYRGVEITECVQSFEFEKKAKASLMNTFGTFLEYSTLGSFWRINEKTVEAFVRLLEGFDEQADGEVLLTENAKGVLLQWIAHVFWSLQHAQFTMNEVRLRQHMVFQRGEFPFYPRSVSEETDAHRIIIGLCKTRIHHLPAISSLLDLFRKAQEYPEEMAHVNSALMVAIDEFSARFRLVELLTRGAQLGATKKEIQTALTTYSFDPDAEELKTKMDDAFSLITDGTSDRDRIPTSQKPSILQLFLVKENNIRRKYFNKFLSMRLTDTDEHFTEPMYDSFKPTYVKLYKDTIRSMWKEHEIALLSPHVAQRMAHRRQVQQTNNKKKRRPALLGTVWEQEVAESRALPGGLRMDPELFWKTGDGSQQERYEAPVIHNKIKTRNPCTDNETGECSLRVTKLEIVDANKLRSPSAQRNLDKLKECDLEARDRLFGKTKGLLKWTDLVLFLNRLGCKIFYLDGSKRKVVDCVTGRCMVLHKPHPDTTCSPYQIKSYREHIVDWLLIKYEDLITLSEKTSNGCPLKADFQDGA